MRILIAEDDPISSRVLGTTLIKWGHEVVITNNGLDALAELQKDDAPPLAILDWMMPGLEGPEVCRRVRSDATMAGTYLILLTALSQPEQMVAGLEAGADDYLTKPFNRSELRVRLQVGARTVDLQSKLVQRVEELEVAVAERHRAEEALRHLTLTDELTGLRNRRGFFSIAENVLQTTQRASQTSVLFYADLDGLKKINDTHGHSVGSLAIVKTAEVLLRTFRSSDIVARLGGDEFAIFAQKTSWTDMEHIAARLESSLRSVNEEESNPYSLSLSVGAVLIDRDNTLSLEKLISKADDAMYLQKRGKKAASERGIVELDFSRNYEFQETLAR